MLSNDFFDAWRPRILSVLRIMAALMFLAHGTAKLFAFPLVPMFANLQILSRFGVAGIIELVGGVLLALGLFTRPVAFLLSGQMAVAYFMVHAPQNFFPILNGGELAALYSFVFLYLAVAGGGAWSLDKLRSADA
ncbi:MULTISPECIES: DoxX family protein [unclassified Xanthobacter]|uniref:DoxX family protein n=1 Tax=unclassified Xanthobacter TaxID=2623496 RepID=UPI001F39A8BB|nr:MULTISPECIES: DoxX family protein [unclassified Xanthobacter]